jgi:hypothetical protein
MVDLINFKAMHDKIAAAAPSVWSTGARPAWEVKAAERLFEEELRYDDGRVWREVIRSMDAWGLHKLAETNNAPFYNTEYDKLYSEEWRDEVFEDEFDDEYRRTHCKHGTFIGGALGPDYLCGKCEMGD